MRIVFLLASLGSGGAERVVSLLANRMCEDGHDIQIVCLKYNDVYYTLHDKIKVVAASEHASNRIMELFWLRKYIQKEKPDVVIPFTEGVYCFTILALLGTGIPIIASERLDPAAMSLPRKILKRLLLPYADWLVVQTESIKAYFPKRIQKKTSVIYNPVNDEVFSLPRTSSLTPTPSPKGEGSIKCEEKLNRIISVARLYPQKNQKMMIEAFAKIADEFPDWQLVIFGEGPLRSSLELLVKSLKLDGRVLLPGRTEHVIEELRKSKIFCLSSDYEGMSNSMIEAICVGLPIITTKVSGTEELIANGENGFVVEVGDLEGLTVSIHSLIKNEALRISMGYVSLNESYMFSLNEIKELWYRLIIRIVSK
jgi:glycosyltransferase involved in cell wall biosynthesis